MPPEYPNVSPPLGFMLPTVRRRVRARVPFIKGIVGQFDETLVNADSSDLEFDGGDDSGYSNGIYPQGHAATTGKPLFIAAETIDDNQVGNVVVRGVVDMYVSTSSGSAGDGLSVGGTTGNGERIVAIALENWTAAGLVRVLFDGVWGFGYDLDAAPDDSPVVTITSPEDGSEHLLGATITFTATAVDPTDGDVSASTDWTSDVDGTIATNDASFTKDDLSLGRHLITATAQDNEGVPNEGSDSIVITIVNPGNQHDPPTGSGAGDGVSVVAV